MHSERIAKTAAENGANSRISAARQMASARGLGVGDMVLLLGDARLLAAQTAQIIELGAAHLAAAHDLDRVDHRRIEREHALDALAVGNLPHGEALVDAAAGARDAHTLVGLHARALALDHLDVDDHGVARSKVRNLLAGGQLGDLLLLDLLQKVHGDSPAAAPRAGRSGGRGQLGLGELLLESFGLVTFSTVIPGRPTGPGPESITTSRDYGFRARAVACTPTARSAD